MNINQIKEAGRLFKSLPNEYQTHIVDQMKMLAPKEDIYQLATICQETTTVAEVVETYAPRQEKENTMTMTLDLQQADFFRDILRNKKYEKLVALKEQFGLKNDEIPQSAQELVDRITGGKFILNAETKDEAQYSKGDLVRSITWRDPAIQKDKAGFDVAEKALGEAYLHAKMAIMTSPADGADVVTKFASA